MIKLVLASCVVLVNLVTVFPQGRRESLLNNKLTLRDGWRIQSSAKVSEPAATLSKREAQTKDWYPASVPSTVVGTLVENKVYAEPFEGMNLRVMPGCKYPIGANFSNLPMPDDSPFRVSWWYRKEFSLPASYQGQNIWLHFAGINFRANVWLNGQKLADSTQIAGTFRTHELNIKDAARPGSINTLAVEVFPQQPDDLAWTWVDWNPMPPDKNMGIFREVFITTSGPVKLRYPQVATHFSSASLDTAQLTVNAELTNATNGQVEGTLQGVIDGIRFAQKVTLPAQETKAISFTPEQFPQLNLKRPRIWWPVHLGPQNLYTLHLEFVRDGQVSDRQNARFGVREITSELDSKNHRVFKVNGRNVLIRGGGWASDMFLRDMPERLRAEFDYVKDMNLNAIRLEGQLQPDYFFDLADEYGILIMAGWCCCSHWEHWQHTAEYKDGPVWDKDDYDIAAKSQADQIRRLRNHPSLLVWLNGSDNPPPADVEQMYIDILKKHQWPNPYISSATAKTTTLTGVTGVKMEGPYEWVPASYWLLDKKNGGAHGFATEISPGPAVPPLESIRRMVPEDHLWPIDDYWNYHAGGGQFKTLKVFTNALEARYGPAKNVEDYALKSQLMTYEGQRAMFEAFGANRYTSNGVIQWMLNNAWPSLIWHLYDYFLLPGGGYFGTKKACEPVHVQYAYDDKSVVAINVTQQPLRNLKLIAQVYDADAVEKFSKEVKVDLPVDSTVKAFVLPAIPDLPATYFLRLKLEDATGKTLSTNFYWLSTKDDTLDWEKSTWYYTPTTSYADMSQLQKLPPVKLDISASVSRRFGEETARVTLANPGKSIAFFIQLQIKRKSDNQSVLPVVWQDNYVTLMPGEKREVTATYRARDLGPTSPVVAVEGWNAVSSVTPLARVR